MTDHHAKAVELHDHARLCLREAEKTKNPSHKKIWRDMAGTWTSLAENEERRTPAPKKPSTA